MKELNYISKAAKIATTACLKSPVRVHGNANIKEKCTIEAFSFINEGTTLFRGTKIGRFCSVGKNCEIGALDHPVTWLSSSPFQYNLKMHFPDYAHDFKQIIFRRPSETKIGNDVWIGSLSIIKRGVTIGDGAIIAGGAVVTNDIPPYAIAGGVPAKILKYRFDDDTINKLLAIKWWNLKISDLNGIEFNDIERAIAQLEKRKA